MKKKRLAILICAALLICSAGCGADKKADAAPSTEETVSEETAAETPAVDAAETPATEEAVAETPETEGSVAEAPAADETPAASSGAEETPYEEVIAEESEAMAGSGDYDYQYAFVNVKGSDDGKIYVYPNGTVNDETVLYNGKTLGGLCDYVDEKVLEKGRTINREFLYDLVALQVIDPELISDYTSFNYAMSYCLTIANEFYSIDVDVKDLILDNKEETKQVFDVVAAGKEDTWIFDGHEKKFYLNNGNTEYTSSMFDAQTMAVWSIALDEYFGESSNY